MAGAFRDLARLCPYLHLPFQSGSNRILESMRRGYTREEYLETIALLRRYRPDLALSTDIIVGYPGETEEDFQATADLVDEVGFDGLFVFEYSPRPRTTAYRLDDDVPDLEKRRRLRFLNDRQQESQAVRNQRRVGSREEVLVESSPEPGRLSGRTPHFRIVHLEGPASLQGRLVNVEITRSGANSLQGRIDASSSLTVGSTAPIF
jgi:tRNA-2-methylthio-N6-dimethylallyladenosine synthase